MTAHRIQVAYVIPGLHYGGMERLVNHLGRELPPRGFEVHIVVIEGLGRFAKELPEGVKFHQVPRMGRWSLLRPIALANLFRDLNPEIVHSHAGIWYKASRAARIAGIPAVVHTEHGRRVPDTVTDRLTDNLASRNTDVVIAVSEALAEVLRRRVVHYPDRVRVIANGVPIPGRRNVAGKEALRRAFGLPANALVLGSVGRLEPVKNYRLALESFARVVTHRADPVFLVLAGDGSERLALERLTSEIGIADRVRFLGWRDDVDRLHALFDVFVMTSQSEGMSVSLLEAMAAGLTPVVTDVGGNRAVLGPELEQMVIPSFDPSEIARAWIRCIEDAALRTSLGEGARKRVERHFSLDHMVDEHIALYRTLLGKSHA